MEIAVQDINLIWMQIYEPYHCQRYTSAQISKSFYHFYETAVIQITFGNSY